MSDNELQDLKNRVEALEQRLAIGGFHPRENVARGERGPELEVIGPARVSSPKQATELLGKCCCAQEIKQQVARLQETLNVIAEHTGKTAERAAFLERWDREGMPGPKFFK